MPARNKPVPTERAEGSRSDASDIKSRAPDHLDNVPKSPAHLNSPPLHNRFITHYLVANPVHTHRLPESATSATHMDYFRRAPRDGPEPDRRAVETLPDRRKFGQNSFQELA